MPKPTLSVVPDPRKSGANPFPAHLRPAAQEIWDILTACNPSMSQEPKLELALSHLKAMNIFEAEREQIWTAVTDELAKPTPSPPSSIGFASKPANPSDDSSPPRMSSNGSPPESTRVPWQSPPEFTWIRPEDVSSFVMSTTKAMLIVLNNEIQNMVALEQRLEIQGPEEHRLMVEKKLTILNLMRLECIEMNLASLPPESGDLVVPNSQLTDQHGRPI